MELNRVCVHVHIRLLDFDRYLYTLFNRILIAINRLDYMVHRYGYNSIAHSNNNNNLFLRSPPREMPIWCMSPPCLWDRDPPLRSDLTAKVYKGVHTLSPSGFEHVAF